MLYVIVIHIICLNLSDNKIYIKSDENIKLLAEMEEQFDKKNEQYFKNFLNHNDNIIRTRAVCVLSDIAGENAVEPISQVLKNDKDVLVRHEAAFSLGQLGYTSAIKALSESVKSDPSFFVRHEAAIALGVIGSEKARKVLNQALNDESDEVRESAIIALANIDYMSTMKRNNKFTRMTGG
jgi:deoxyhypusine monooxygenase